MRPTALIFIPFYVSLILASDKHELLNERTFMGISIVFPQNFPHAASVSENNSKWDGIL